MGKMWWWKVEKVQIQEPVIIQTTSELLVDEGMIGVDDDAGQDSAEVGLEENVEVNIG